MKLSVHNTMIIAKRLGAVCLAPGGGWEVS
jgi:hypothetical protein